VDPAISWQASDGRIKSGHDDTEPSCAGLTRASATGQAHQIAGFLARP
jgi:hypothetical protein